MLTKYWRTERARRQLLRSILPRPGITPRAGETKEEWDHYNLEGWRRDPPVVGLCGADNSEGVQ